MPTQNRLVPTLFRPIPEYISQKENATKPNKVLSASELEGLHLVLNGEKIDITQPAGYTKASEIIQALIDKNCTVCVDPPIALAQYQQYICPDQKAVKNSIQVLLQDPQYALHTAAKKGVLPVVKMLVEAGYDVNGMDLFGSTPLHIAAMYGQTEVMNYLIQQGSNVNAAAYKQFPEDEGYTPLDLAFKYAPNVDAINILLEAGGESGNWFRLSYFFGEDFEPFILGISKDYGQFDLILNKWEAIAKANSMGLWYLGVEQQETIPLSLLFQAVLPMIKEEKFYDRLKAAIFHLDGADQEGFAGHYLLAKNLLHSFPTDEVYEFSLYHVAGQTPLVQAEGHFSMYFTADLARRSLEGFNQKMKYEIDFQGYQASKALFPDSNEFIFQNIQDYTDIKDLVFGEVKTAYELATIAAEKAGIFSNSEALFEQYQAGKTIILPTGWFGHGIDIILDKPRQLFMVANAGDRYSELPPGVNAYHFNKEITVEDIYHILTNEDKIDLELKYFYDLELVFDPTYSFETDEQEFGNCAWNSQKITEKAMIFLELDKFVSDQELAKTLSHIWYEQLDDYHQTSILKEYLASPSLEFEAVDDIAMVYFAGPDTAGKQERLDLIAEYVLEHFNLKELLEEEGFTPASNASAVLAMDEVIQLDNVDPFIIWDTHNGIEPVNVSGGTEVGGEAMPVVPVLAMEILPEISLQAVFVS